MGANLNVVSPDVVIAVPKGRILKALVARFGRSGIDIEVLLKSDRRLIRDIAGLRFLLLKPDDVPTYVDYGTADLGVVGRDVLVERGYGLYAPVDLGIGRCRMVVAGPSGQRFEGTSRARPLRVATKYPSCAHRHFLSRGQPVETVFVQGSVELAPTTGLADVIVDLVESGETLRQNGLTEIEEVFPVSSVVVANRVGMKLKRDRITPLLQRLDRPTEPVEA